MKNPLINKRTFIVVFSLIVMYLTLVIYLFYLQIINGIKYKLLSNKNNCKIRYIFSPRGIIYDRYKQPLVSNKISFRLVLMVKKNKTLKELITEISNVLDMNIKDIEKNINQNYFTIIKKFKNIDEVNSWKYNKKLNENVFFEEYWCRENLYECFNHMTGYIKYDLNTEIPMNGLEKSYSTILEGKKICHKIYLDTHKNIISHTKQENYEKGKDLITTFHMQAQLYAEELFKSHTGSIIVMNKNGEVLVAYSSPHLKVYEESINIKKNNYFNKLFQGKYPPGSIFKVISILSLFTTGEFQSVCCNGSMYIGNRKFHCWKRTGHGQINSIEDAFKKSCNIFFYVNCSNLKDFMKYFFIYIKELGFEEKTQHTFPEEISSKMKRPKTKSEMMMMGIGQGFANTTLIQNCKLVASLITKNKINPIFIKTQNTFEKLNIDESILAKVKKAISSTFEEGGNCYHLRKENYDFFGKTGTAQVMSMKDGKSFVGYKKEHALFTGGELKSGLFVSALVENAGFGVATAGLFATQLIEFIISKKIDNN
jgi:penicillin-binding protein 2